MYFIHLGPLLYKGNPKGNGVHRIIAIVSWGFGCAKWGRPGYYAPVYPHRKWIRGVMKEMPQCPNLDGQTCSSPITANQNARNYVAILLLILTTK